MMNEMAAADRGCHFVAGGMVIRVPSLSPTIIMVSADNLNFDVLEVIFSFLSGHDLHSVALVSHSFYAGVLPRLYRTLRYTMRHGKKFPRVRPPPPSDQLLLVDPSPSRALHSVLC